MHLIFDTETTGLLQKGMTYKSKDAPRLVTLSFLLADEDLNVVRTYDKIIIPQGFVIPPESAKVHGVTQEVAMREGIPLRTALSEFQEALNSAHTLVAHNLEYDLLVMRAEFFRMGLKAKRVNNLFCTKDHSTNLCKIPGKYGQYKWPTLAEACKILCNHEFYAHVSKNDTLACLFLYRHLINK